MLKSAREAKLKMLARSLPLKEKAELVEGVSHEGQPNASEKKLHFSMPSISFSKEAKDTLMVLSEEPAGPPPISYPSPAALACSFDTELVKEIYGEIAADRGRYGRTVIQGPSAGIKRCPTGGGNPGYFSEDPYLTGIMAEAAAEGIKAAGYKALVSDIGSSGRNNMRYVNDDAVDERALHEIYYAPAEAALRAKPEAVSLAESQIRGGYVTEDEHLIQELIRTKWGFDGAVVAAPGSVSDRVESLLAGVDVESTGCTENSDEIVDAVSKGDVTEERIAEAAQRAILLADRQGDGKLFREEEALLVSRRAAGDSAVLLKNNGGLFPIAQGDEFALIGVHAMNLPEVSHEGIALENADSVLGELQKLGASFRFAPGYTFSGDTNSLLVNEAKEIAAELGRAVIVVGVPGSGNADWNSLSLPNGILKLIDEVSVVSFQTAVVFVTGRPVEMPFADRVQTILAAYYSGRCTGGAIADIILGKVNPSGKLAETWPKKLSDCPSWEWFSRNRRYTEHREGIYVGYRYYFPARVSTLFDFGHGMSYTRFVYGAMTVIAAENGWTVQIPITNAGARAGSEIIQLYSVLSGGDMLELKGFAKLHLLAGETKTAEILLTPDSFRRYDEKVKDFEIQGGDYLLFAAASSTDLRESAELHVEGKAADKFPAYFGAAEAGKISDSAFEKLLGYKPDTGAPSIVALESTLNDISHTTIGEGIIHDVASTILGFDPDEKELEEFMKKAGDYPLRTLSDLLPDAFPRSKSEGIVRVANRDFISSAAALLFSRRRKK